MLQVQQFSQLPTSYIYIFTQNRLVVFTRIKKILETVSQNHTFNGILNVRFFSFFSVPRSTTVGSSAVVFEVVLFPASASSSSLFSFEFSSEAVPVEALPVVVLVLVSIVTFFFGTSTHSVISITASPRSRLRIPLLLREKCKFALIGADRFRDEYLSR